MLDDKGGNQSCRATPVLSSLCVRSSLLEITQACSNTASIRSSELSVSNLISFFARIIGYSSHYEFVLSCAKIFALIYAIPVGQRYGAVSLDR